MVWFPKQADILLAESSTITIDETGDLDSAFSEGTAIEGTMKDITWTPSTGDANVINKLGTDTDGFQNADLEETPPDLVEVSGTMVLPGNEVAESLLYDSSSSVTGGYTRYRVGKAVRKKLALCMSLDDGTDKVNVAITDAILTSNEISVTGTDGHFEATVTFKCLIKNYYGPEFAD